MAAGAVMSPALSLDPNCKVRMMKYLAMGAIHTVGTDNCTFSLFCSSSLFFYSSIVSFFPSSVSIASSLFA